MSHSSPLLGFDIPSWAKTGFGVVHTGGVIVLSALGMKSLADSLTQLEDNAGLLPQWAGGTQPEGDPTAFVDKPDHVVLVSPDGTSAVVAADRVLLYGGTRMAGNGYQPGQSPENGKFSFGYDGGASALTAVVVKGDQKANAKVRAVLFLGGTESVPPTEKKPSTIKAPAGKLPVKQARKGKAPSTPRYVGGEDTMTGLDCLGADEEIGFDYMSLLKGGAGMLSGAGGLLSGGGGGGGGGDSEKKRLEEEKARAEKSAKTLKTVLIILASVVGVGGLVAAVVALGRK